MATKKVAKTMKALGRQPGSAKFPKTAAKTAKKVPFVCPVSIALDKDGDICVKGKLVVPKDLPVVADTLYAVRQLRLKTAKALEELGKYEGELRETLIEKVGKDSVGVMGRSVRATIVIKPIPHIADEKKFSAFANRKGNEDLMTHKPNLTAIKERWDAKKSVPGVDTFNAVSVSLNKL